MIQMCKRNNSGYSATLYKDKLKYQKFTVGFSDKLGFKNKSNLI